MTNTNIYYHAIHNSYIAGDNILTMHDIVNQFETIEDAVEFYNWESGQTLEEYLDIQDSQCISFTQDLEEVKEIAEYTNRAKILVVELSDEYINRIIINSEGYPMIEGQIPAELIIDIINI